MPTTLMAFPFRLTASGSVATQEDNSDEYHAGELAQLVMTHIGERELVPDYGVTDPAFYSFDEVEFVDKATIFVPGVRIVAVSPEFVGDTQQVVEVEFDSVDDFADTAFEDTDSVVEYTQE